MIRKYKVQLPSLYLLGSISFFYILLSNTCIVGLLGNYIKWSIQRLAYSKVLNMLVTACSSSSRSNSFWDFQIPELKLWLPRSEETCALLLYFSCLYHLHFLAAISTSKSNWDLGPVFQPTLIKTRYMSTVFSHFQQGLKLTLLS